MIYDNNRRKDKNKKIKTEFPPPIKDPTGTVGFNVEFKVESNEKSLERKKKKG